MNDELKNGISESASAELERAAEAADAELEAALQEPASDTYVHTLRRPLDWNENRYEKLTFQWDNLTAADHLAVERELLFGGGKTLVTPEYDGDYLLGIAARACVELGDKSARGHLIAKEVLRALPLGDFLAISRAARGFLLRTGLVQTPGRKSEKPV